MTSVYDNMYDEDLPGFLCVKTQFWDKGHVDAETYVRRRSVDGEWIWLKSRVVSYIEDSEISAFILEETSDCEDAIAIEINRVTRFVSIVVQAVEAAWLTSEQSKAELKNDKIRVNTCDVSELQESGVHMNETTNSQHSNPVSATASTSATTATTTNEHQSQDPNNEQRKSFDPNSVVESVRQGVRLDLGLSLLKPDEVKLVTLILTGMIPVDEVSLLLWRSWQMGLGVDGITSRFVLESEEPVGRSSGRQRAKSDIFSPNGGSPKSFFSLSAPPPPVSVVNLSYTYIGNTGVEMLSDLLHREGSCLTTLDISFCGIDEKGFQALARALTKRKRKHVAALKGLILSGNFISPRSASEIGAALSLSASKAHKRRRRTKKTLKTGYDSDTTESDIDDDDDENDDFTSTKRQAVPARNGAEVHKGGNSDGLQVLHVAHSSMNSDSVRNLLESLGSDSTIRELNLSSNNFGPAGAVALVAVFRSRGKRTCVAMPCLDRLDMSNNDLGDEGTAQLTMAIIKRPDVHLVDLRVSSNSIGSGGIETIMNKLLHHNLVSLALDKNSIGDQGCQLVAASLQSMPSLSRLNLSFNQIGSRGITSLMRSFMACKSITYLGLSGNILRISGAISLSFALSQHPRLEELDLDNCCLGQAAQCHIVAGIISNRWVPMKRLKGYAVGPPMAAIGAVEASSANLSNEECLRIRKDEQMKTMLQWMEANRTAKKEGCSLENLGSTNSAPDCHDSRFLSPDFVSRINDVHGTPSQNAYLRLLGWLSRIPFDEDELTALQKYFYETDGVEGDRSSDGYINLKLRGDLLAALDGEEVDEIRDATPSISFDRQWSIGMDIDKAVAVQDWNAWFAFQGTVSDNPSYQEICTSRKLSTVDESTLDESSEKEKSSEKSGLAKNSTSESLSTVGREKKSKVKLRITMFPQFEQQLSALKSSATELIEQEEDAMQHEVILIQYAEASLTILRQLRYHCMNSGLDGWRQSGLSRKILVVDDSQVTRKLVARAFEKAGFIVDTASNGEEGVEKLKASLYDITFMDIDMPVMNGFEATKKLREWEDTMRPGARQPICALTATYVDDFERSELMKFKEAGLDVMESKPCNIPRLFKVVDDVSPMFSDLSITVMNRVRSESSLEMEQEFNR